MSNESQIHTYFYFHQDTLRVDVGFFTNAFEHFIKNVNYTIIKKVDGKLPVVDFSCHAINEDGIPYAVNMPAINAEHAEEMFKSLYPNDNLIEVKEIVYDGKPMIY